MFLSYLTLFIALALSAVAAFYSIAGLTAIFAAAVIPIIIMGSILEVAKIVTTLWLHEYWRQAKLSLKMYLVPAVAVLMVLTSMGIFGFLSKAHLDQTVPVGDVVSQVSLFDEKIKNERDTIANARTLLGQLDKAVSDISSGPERQLSGGRTQSAAERALQVRRQQARDRAALTKTIEEAQARIVKLQEERAPVASQARKVEAEVGPIKYVAALIYGDNPDANTLERAVRWVIILIVAVFDPLAIMLLLAATESIGWVKALRKKKEDDDGDPVPPRIHTVPDNDVDMAGHPARDNMAEPSLPEMGPRPEPVIPYQVLDDVSDPEPAPEYLTKGYKSFRNLKPVVASVDTPAVDPVVEVKDEDDDEDLTIEGLKDLGNNYISYQGKVYSRQAFNALFPSMLPAADDSDHIVGDARFGTAFPKDATKGDLFVRVDYLPTKLFKYNGSKWIEVNKELNTSFAHNDAYLDLLMEKLASGEYDIDMLNDAEREQLETRLKAQDE